MEGGVGWGAVGGGFGEEVMQVGRSDAKSRSLRVNAEMSQTCGRALKTYFF